MSAVLPVQHSITAVHHIVTKSNLEDSCAWTRDSSHNYLSWCTTGFDSHLWLDLGNDSTSVTVGKIYFQLVKQSQSVIGQGLGKIVISVICYYKKKTVWEIVARFNL